MVANAGKHIAKAMRIAQAAVSEGTTAGQITGTLFIIDGYHYDTQTGVQTPNVVLSGDIVGSISNDFDRNRDIQNSNKRTVRYHVSREALVAIGVSVDMFDSDVMKTESYFEVKGRKWNIDNISGRTGNLYITFYLEPR